MEFVNSTSAHYAVHSTITRSGFSILPPVDSVVISTRAARKNASLPQIRDYATLFSTDLSLGFPAACQESPRSVRHSLLGV